MEQPKTQMADPLIDQVRETRERLVREHGGLRQWVARLQEQQREHPERFPRRAEQPNRSAE